MGKSLLTGIAMAAAAGVKVERMGNEDYRRAPHGLYATREKDRWLSIAVETDEQWQALLRVMNRSELAADPRFATPEKRHAEREWLDTVVSDDNEAAGAMADVAAIDVTTTDGATAALTTIETAIQSAIDAAAEFGSAEKRIENQQDFVGKLMDAMKGGISAMTDTDMEEASARLQSLQVQQQLGVQALSIANSNTQQILGLFR